MGALSYSTNHFLRRLVFEGEELKSAVYFEKEAVEKGMVFLGRIESFHAPMRGYFVDLGSGKKGLYQSGEKLLVGKHYLFEVHSVGRGKPVLLSRRIGFVGQYVIFRPTAKSAMSRHLDEQAKSRLAALGEDNVYYRKEAEEAEADAIREEIASLRQIYEEVRSLERTQRRAHLVYQPPLPQETDDLSFILSYEEEILRYSQTTVYEEDMTYHIEPTKVGLVIDVNSGASELDIPALNDQAVRFVHRLLVRMNVGGLVLVDLIGNGQQRERFSLLQADPRITHADLSSMGILEITRKRNGTNMYEVPMLQIFADYLALHRKQREEAGEVIQELHVSKRFVGIEAYVNLPVKYSEVFGWFRFL